MSDLKAQYNQLPKYYSRGLLSAYVDDDPRTLFRSRSWIPMLVKELENNKNFIIMGVAHLYGTNGVLSLLEENGFKVRKY